MMSRSRSQGTEVTIVTGDVFETLVFATSGILSMHYQLVTLKRERKT